uniref:Uncharacterized protein n=1 Tax=Parascaris equorum TaxID=6256 RepID=A0A914S1G6_PAREQ
MNTWSISCCGSVYLKIVCRSYWDLTCHRVFFATCRFRHIVASGKPPPDVCADVAEWVAGRF